jgi:hypothetical protein
MESQGSPDIDVIQLNKLLSLIGIRGTEVKLLNARTEA